MLIFLIIVFGSYTLLVLVLSWGWASLDDRTAPDISKRRKITVAVAFRNEENNIQYLIEDLKMQDYPEDLVEFRLIDDHSEDQSLAIARRATEDDSRFVIMSADHTQKGKKSALNAAINITESELIVVTDGDCRMPKKWLECINQQFETSTTRMVIGPVRLVSKRFESLQAMEFASLIGTAGAAVSLGRPVLGNAANFAFRREDFFEVRGFEDNADVSSGDDHYLIGKFANRWERCIAYMHDPDAIVVAEGSERLSHFVSQRLRWAGKWQLSHDVSSWLALVIIGFHICNLFALAALGFGYITPRHYVALAGAKAFAEFIFLFPVCRFLRVRWSWTSFVALQLFYSIYVVIIGLLSQVLAPRWKGRGVITRASVR